MSSIILIVISSLVMLYYIYNFKYSYESQKYSDNKNNYFSSTLAEKHYGHVKWIMTRTDKVNENVT